MLHEKILVEVKLVNIFLIYFLKEHLARDDGIEIYVFGHSFLLKSHVCLSSAITPAKVCCTPVSRPGASKPFYLGLNIRQQ